MSEQINETEKKSAEVPQVKGTKTDNIFAKVATKKPAKSKKSEDAPRGLSKSGRPWKTPKQKFSSIKKSLYRNSFEKKMELRNEIRHVKELSKSIKDAKKESKELMKQRRLQNAERRLENERRSEIVQVIKNPSKLKRMKKKQMRLIEKRDLNKVKVV